jgi:glycosyltransferase involved in cell wall biosynthesis
VILGLLPGAGGGIRALQGSGQHERLLGSYFRAYAEAFDRTYYFSYLKEALSDYTADRHLLSRVTVLPKRGRVPYRMYSLAMPVMYRQRIAECDVLRVFQATGALPALAASVLYGVPYVTTYGYRYAEFATVEGRYLASLRLKLVEFLALRGSAAVIVTTQELADWVSARVVRERVHLIPNGVDISLFGERCEPPDGDPPVIGFVGRLETQKNLDLLIDAAARINTRVQLLLIGEGTLQRDLERQAASLEIGVRFAGMVPHIAY